MSKRRTLWWCAIAGIIVLIGCPLLWLYTSHEPLVDGPISKSALGNTNWTQTTYKTKVGSRVFFGGFAITNQTNSSYKILSVTPTNMSSGLKFVQSAMLKLPPEVGVGPVDWLNHTIHQQLRVLPMKIIDAKQAFEPGIVLEPKSPGTYVIQGLLVKYSWHGANFTDYMPDQLILCVGDKSAPGTCSAKSISPPPTHWNGK